MINRTIITITLFGVLLLTACSNEEKIPTPTLDHASSLLNSGMFEGERSWRSFGEIPSFPVEDERRRSGKDFFSERKEMPYTQMMKEFKESVETRLNESPLYAKAIQSNIYQLIDKQPQYLEAAPIEDIAWSLEILVNTKAVEWETLTDFHLQTKHLRDDNRNQEISDYITENATNNLLFYQTKLTERQEKLAQITDKKETGYNTHQFAIKNLEGDIAMTERALAKLKTED